MSPGVTFERVYRELKRRLADGTLRPGQPIEPAQMSTELAASITPIRDALHRLVGERLVEAPNHNGFRVPRLTEAELRDLYIWNGQLLGLAIRQIRRESLGSIAPPSPDISVALATADLFLRVAKTVGSAELAHAMGRLNERLAPYRRLEAGVLDDLAEEVSALGSLLQVAERTQLNRALARYHRRRATSVPLLLDGLSETD